MVWKMFFLFQSCILRFHVNLPGCKPHVFFVLKESNGTINAVLGVDEVLADDFSDLIPPMYSNLLTFTIKIKTNVGEYTIHAWYGYDSGISLMGILWNSVFEGNLTQMPFAAEVWLRLKV